MDNCNRDSINILLVSVLTPQTPCGIVTYYQILLDQFKADPEVNLTLVTIDDAPAFGRKLAGLVHRLLNLAGLVDKRAPMYANDAWVRLLLRFALYKYRSEDFHLIHAQETISGSVARRFFKGRVPIACTCHFNDSPVEEDLLAYRMDDPSIRQYLIRKYRRQFADIDRFIFVSKYCFENSKYLITHDPDIFVIHNGVPLDKFTKKNGVRPDQGRLEIINTGHIEARKNQRILAPIARELVGSGFTDFHITILGTGPDLSGIRAQIREYGLEPYFSLPGWVNNVNDYLDKADLCIHTAINDNCPYSVIESIARKTPVIGFRVGGIPEILDENFLFELNDTKSIARFVLENHKRLDAIADEQYNAIETEFSIRHQIDQVKRLYFSSRPQTAAHSFVKTF